MYMQITSSEKIHKLTSLKFEVPNVARKTINGICCCGDPALVGKAK